MIAVFFSVQNNQRHGRKKCPRDKSRQAPREACIIFIHAANVQYVGWDENANGRSRPTHCNEAVRLSAAWGEIIMGCGEMETVEDNTTSCDFKDKKSSVHRGVCTPRDESPNE